MSEVPAIHGECAERFRAVREAFEASFRTRDEIGAAVSVCVDGETVVDLWAGHADPGRTRPWQRDTLVNVYSTTKGMTAFCAHQLVEQRRLDLDAPVAEYWPEFARAGKGDLPVRWLLSHRAGLPAVKEPLPPEALFDWRAMVDALAAQEPWWKPGETHGYHALTYGWLVGEVVRRIAGRSLGTYFREEIAAPLGADFHIGLADAEHGRVGDLTPLPTEGAEGEPALAELFVNEPESMTALAFTNPPSINDGPHHAAWRRAEIPGANGHGTARAIARIYGAVARGGDLDGVHVLDAPAIARCHAEQSRGPDLVLQVPTRFGLGFMLSQPGAAFGPNPRAFGHPGAGGSLGFADPDAKLGFGYTMNRLGPHILIDPRPKALFDAAYASLAA